MYETTEFLFRHNTELCIIFPSLNLSFRKFKQVVKRSSYEVCFVNYSGFGNSIGSFPGRNIIRGMDKVLDMIAKKENKKMTRIIGDSYGGLIALGLLSRYKRKYAGTIILTSPLISFERLEQNSSSRRSKNGFVKYLKEHKSIGKIDTEQLLKLLNHEEIKDPFKSKIVGSTLKVYHYENDRNLDYKVSRDFCKIKKAKIIKLEGTNHSLINFDKTIIDEIFYPSR